jgi:hypothetical protein
MTSKAQRRGRKRKAAPVNLPGETPQESNRYPSGKAKPEDPRKTALHARCRRAGISDPKEAARALLGTEMGLCINASATGQELADLTEAWQAISASFRNYRLLVIGQTGDPQGAAIGMIPDKVETDPSLRVDLRTHDERVEAAKRSKAQWDARIAALPVPTMKWALRGALEGFMGEDSLWRDCAPTTTGRLAVEALRRVMG